MPPPAKLSSAGIFQKQRQAPVVRQINTHTDTRTHTSLRWHYQKKTPKSLSYVIDAAQNVIMIISKILVTMHHTIHIIHWIKDYFDF